MMILFFTNVFGEQYGTKFKTITGDESIFTYMAHDPCIICGSYDGEINISGDVPHRVTVCSFDCLRKYARNNMESEGK